MKPQTIFPVLSLAMLLALLHCHSGLLAQEKQKPGGMIIQWEYKVISPPRKDNGFPLIVAEKLQELLNNLGAEGWECAGTINDVHSVGRQGTNITDVYLILKRVKRQ